MHRKMVKFGLISGGHIRPGPDMAGYENLAEFRPGPGPDMISGATLLCTQLNDVRLIFASPNILAPTRIILKLSALKI